MVIIVPGVLDGQEGVDHGLGNLFIADVFPDFVSEFVDQVAVAVKHPGVGQGGQAFLKTACRPDR